ncbi:protein of unknown function DUF1058 [Alkalilimnicola ehrlichii MLHE-1]|uniref:SH3b domain-containing protein n=1 Tax=Alkalilimnicola ehrlichii (strain ATCC BAA-1101 / DSM 17681 / MLHE-1) TaxID=187272 RepID=Q0ABR7_ALKEH|nr:protein of unknown function DUF1058 [Alkalilimnicola ehrlichii MLHE-1]
MPVRRICLLLLLLLTALPLTAHAQVYVSDQLEVAKRSGPSMQHRILRFVSSGTQLQQLDSSGDWTQVRDGQGREGWIETRHLMNEPSARQRLEAANRRVEAAEEAREEMAAQLAETREHADELAERVAALESERDRLEARLEDAREGLELADEHQRLQTTISDLQAEIRELEADKTALARQTQRDWFLAGAGVLLVGLILGLILPRIRWKRRRGWGDTL